MNKLLQFPLIRIIIAVLLIGVGIAVGQIILNLLRAVLSITNTGIANLLAFILIAPATYFAYWIYVHYLENVKWLNWAARMRFKSLDLVH
jgi:hypothetical protein